MATIDSPEVIQQLIANHGYYEGDPRVALIVEYTNASGRQTWGITYTTDSPTRQRRYLEETEWVRAPKVIWSADQETH